MEYENLASIYVCVILYIHSVMAELHQREPPPPRVRHAVCRLLQILAA